MKLNLHEEPEDQAGRNARMKQQLQHSKLQQQVDAQAKEIKELKMVVLQLKRNFAYLVKKLGP